MQNEKKGDIPIVDRQPDNLRLLSAMLSDRGDEIRAVMKGMRKRVLEIG